jgi:glycerol 2-dehydrogenase (NADP+)
MTVKSALAHIRCHGAHTFESGNTLPAVGMGTWQGQRGSVESQNMKNTLIAALKFGYRHIDTAQVYGVEDIVGDAVRESGIPREEIVVATKFWGDKHHDPEAALEDSLKVLGLDYIDIVSQSR